MPCFRRRYAVLPSALCRAFFGAFAFGLGKHFDEMFLLGGSVGFFDFDPRVRGLKIDEETNFFHFFVGLDKPRFYVALVCSAQPGEPGQRLEGMIAKAGAGKAGCWVKRRTPCRV